MENFFKRKDPLNGTRGVSASANKSAKTSSPSGGSGASPKWTALHGSLMARFDPACAPNAKVAAFDLDDTLQKTRSGRPGYMVSDLDDFVFWSDRVAETLRAVHAQGHAVVIFSNQGGVKGALDGKRADVVRRRVDALAKTLGVPLHFFCGTQKGAEKDPFRYRKPETGAWRYFEQHCNGGVKVDLVNSYYVGDAAGRPNDHSDSDKEFAKNVGVRFFTPEAYFLEGAFERFVDKKSRAEKAENKAPPEPEPIVVLLDDDDDDANEQEKDFDREGTP